MRHCPALVAGPIRGARGFRDDTWRFTGSADRTHDPSSMSMLRSCLRLATVAALAVALAGCGRTESYRYKLTLAVNTPDGVKRGSSVGEVVFWNVSIPDRGTMHKLRGEALYLNLGAGARPLVA